MARLHTACQLSIWRTTPPSFTRWKPVVPLVLTSRYLLNKREALSWRHHAKMAKKRGAILVDMRMVAILDVQMVWSHHELNIFHLYSIVLPEKSPNHFSGMSNWFYQLSRWTCFKWDKLWNVSSLDANTNYQHSCKVICPTPAKKTSKAIRLTTPAWSWSVQEQKYQRTWRTIDINRLNEVSVSYNEHF